MAHFSSKPCDDANAQCCCSGWIEWKPALCVLQWGTTAAIEAQVIYDGEVQSDMLSGAIMPNPNWGTWQLWIRCTADGPMFLAAETEVIDPLDYEEEEYSECVGCCERLSPVRFEVDCSNPEVGGEGGVPELSGTYLLYPVLQVFGCYADITVKWPTVWPVGSWQFQLFLSCWQFSQGNRRGVSTIAWLGAVYKDSEISTSSGGIIAAYTNPTNSFNGCVLSGQGSPSPAEILFPAIQDPGPLFLSYTYSAT